MTLAFKIGLEVKVSLRRTASGLARDASRFYIYYNLTDRQDADSHIDMAPLEETEAEALQASLELERQVTDEDVLAQTRRIFQEKAPLAAVAICKLAIHGTKEDVQLKAATYIVERVIGRVQDDPPPPTDNPYETLINSITSYVENHKVPARELLHAEAVDEPYEQLGESE